MKRGVLWVRPSWRSSLLGHPSARFFAEDRQELRKQEKPKLLVVAATSRHYRSIDGLAWRTRGGDRSRAHSAGSSRPFQGASQIVLRVAMMTREIWASQAEDSLHLSWRYVHGEQFSSQPQIDDAPVKLGKAFLNMPTLHPGSIYPRRCVRRQGALLADMQARIDRRRRRGGGWLGDGLQGRMQQIVGSTSQDGTSFDDFDPRSRTRGSTAFEFLIGKACQSSQMTPVGASQVASVGVSQLFTNQGGERRFQGRDADVNPSLKMARAGLKHDTRFMAMGSHPRQHIGCGMIQVEENIAGVAILGVREKINVKALEIACTQEAQHHSTCQVSGCPQPFSWSWPVCGGVNQTDEVEIIRHGRELAANRLGHQKESAIEHEHDNAAEASRAFKGFSANGNNPLKPVSQSRGALQS